MMNSQGQALKTAMSLILFVIVLLFVVGVPLYRAFTGYSNDSKCANAGGNCQANCVGEQFQIPGYTCPENEQCCFNEDPNNPDVQQGGTAIEDHTVAILMPEEYETLLQQPEVTLNTNTPYDFFGYSTGDRIGVCAISILKQDEDDQSRVMLSRTWMDRDVCISSEMADNKKVTLEVNDQEYVEGRRYFLQFIAWDKRLGTEFHGNADWQEGGASRAVAWNSENWVTSYSKELTVKRPSCESYNDNPAGCRAREDACVWCPRDNYEGCLRAASDNAKTIKCATSCGSDGAYQTINNLNECAQGLPGDDGYVLA